MKQRRRRKNKMPAKPQRKKSFEVEIPFMGEKTEAIAYDINDLDGRTLKLDMARSLRGKSADMVLKIKLQDSKAIARPKKMIVLPFFIKHMLRKGVSYVEDSFAAETKESKAVIKPFFITRKKVSRAVKRTLRNSAKNWIIDYAKTKTDEELFSDVLSGKLQKPLSLKLKKIYPLALCEIRILEIKELNKKGD